MKKIYSLLCLAVFFAGCEEKQYEYILERPADEMKLTASNDKLVLSDDLKNETALTLTWGKATDRGPDTKISYRLKLDVAGSLSSTTVIVKNLEESVRSVSYTHGELNEFLTKNWKITPGDPATIEAKIIADVVESPVFMMPEISSATVQVTGYQMALQNLYLLGTATGNTNPSDAPVFEVLTFNQEYLWKGNLSAGTFKIITDKIGELPSYNKGEDNQTLVYRESDAQPDDLFAIDKPGNYSVYLDVEAMRIAYAPLPYEKVWFLGDATPAGWAFEKAIQMDWEPKNPEIFVYEVQMTAGEIKFPLQTEGWNGAFFMAMSAALPIVSGTEYEIQVITGGAPDNKWKITEAGNYRITVNPSKRTVVFDKL